MGMIIYTQLGSECIKVQEPTKPESSYNFIIRRLGMDWSGYRTLQGCVQQFVCICVEKPNNGYTLEQD